VKILIALAVFCFQVMLYANDNIPYSITFAQAADLAVASSADLRYAAGSQTVREGMWKWGLRAFFPRMSLSISENDRLQIIGSDSFTKNYGLNMDQLVFDGGKTSMARKLERMELDLSAAALKRAALETADRALSAYRNVLSSRAILEIRKEALVVLEEQRRILNEEVLLGLALPVDLASADINLAEAKLNIISLQLDLEEMERQFAELLGLDDLPVLTEKVDVNRRAALPAPEAAQVLAKEQNPDLIEARYSITKKQAELKYASNTWIPTLRLIGGFSVSGQRYPLTRGSWSIGMNVEFSDPWIQNSLGIQAGMESSKDKTAMLQNSVIPMPDPASRYGKKQAALALSLEQDKYNLIFEQIGRIASNAVTQCALAEQKRVLALEAAALGSERCRIESIRLDLGYITRLDLMETLIEQTQKEITAIEAAASLLEAERELEKFLDLQPGEFAVFAAERRNL
jgi:outer membrane protein TolC